MDPITDLDKQIFELEECRRICEACNLDSLKLAEEAEDPGDLVGHLEDAKTARDMAKFAERKIRALLGQQD